MTYFITIAILTGIIFVLLFILIAQSGKQKSKENKELKSTINKQREVVEVTNKIKEEVENEKQKLTKGTDTERFNASLDQLHNLKH